MSHKQKNHLNWSWNKRKNEQIKNKTKKKEKLLDIETAFAKISVLNVFMRL